MEKELDNQKIMFKFAVDIAADGHLAMPTALITFNRY
jgi:hypothetical protein